MKTKLRQLVPLLFCLLAGGTVSAQNALKFSLEEAKVYALKNSYVVRNSGVDVLSARKKVWETIATGLPQINGSADYTKNIDATKSPMPVAIIPKDYWPFLGIPDDTPITSNYPLAFAQKYYSNWGVAVSQTIFDGSYIVGVGSAKIYLQLAEQAKEKTEIEINYAVEQAYYLTLIATENLAVMKENLTNSRKLETETKAMYTQGFVEEQDADQMRLLVQRAENEVLKAEREIRVAGTVLKYTMGVDMELTVELTDQLDDFLQPILAEDEHVPGFDHSIHIDYRMLDTQREASQKLLLLEKSAYLPKISAFYNWNKSSFGDSANLFKNSVPWFKSSMLGVNISVPIFSAGERMAKVRQAEFAYEKSVNDQKLAVQSLQKDYLTAVADVESAVDQLKNDEDNKMLAKKILDKTVIKYNNGMVSSTELAQTESQYIQSQGAWVSSVMQLLNYKINLDKATGK
ncbi:TolC family protein [Gaoshiqia sp. Z1-71]|uniref:TolC family protein n=1 Tax=Gaoshiqia hydrogeniformans TaxID=3290090 RepID=UPI003BF8ECD0